MHHKRPHFCRILHSCFAFLLSAIVTLGAFANARPLPDGGPDAMEWTDTTRTDSTIVQTVGSDAVEVFRVAGATATAPLHWDATSWMLAGGTVVATAGASLLDNGVHSMMLRNQGRFNDHISDVAVVYGDGKYMFSLAAGGYAIGLIAHGRWLRETSLMAFSAMALSGAFSSVLKAATGRSRPFTGEGNHFFRPGSFSQEGRQSFPSGHTVVAFSVSTVLSRRIGSPWATVGLYMLAGATAASRLYTADHWFSDVVFGAAAATAISWNVVTLFEQSEDTRISIVPTPAGVSLRYAL